MNIKTRIDCFTELGIKLEDFLTGRAETKVLSEAVNKSFYENQWFAKTNIMLALRAIAELLKYEKLKQWTANYPLPEQNNQPANIGVIMAGNIPAVGFHDFLTVLISGNKLKVKLSSDDKYIIPALSVMLSEINKEFEFLINFTSDKLSDFDAVIATGSNNSARYFESYFGKYPHIIRKNRNSLAVLAGVENKDELSLLGKDIYQYFGLGCRNVSTIYIKRDFNFEGLFDSLQSYSSIIENNKYLNNYNYYRTIFSMNTQPFMDNGFSLFREEDSLHAPVSVINYKFYDDINEVNNQIDLNRDNIQCVVASEAVVKNAIPFGKTQTPELCDYADGVDTMKFLLSIRK